MEILKRNQVTRKLIGELKDSVEAIKTRLYFANTEISDEDCKLEKMGNMDNKIKRMTM